MTVTDRWHMSRPRPGEPVCTEHGKAPTADHGQGDRWQVRWRDDNNRQRKQNFARRADADGFDSKIRAELNAGMYVDRATGNVTFKRYAEEWRKARTHGETTGINVEHQFRLHVYSDLDNPGRSRRDGPALGHHRIRDLAKRPSLCQQ